MEAFYRALGEKMIVLVKYPSSTTIILNHHPQPSSSTIILAIPLVKL
jgi:hypothetical protein